MAVNEETHWSFVLVKGGSFSHTLAFEDDEASPFAVAGTSPRLLVKFGSETLEWTLANGQFTLLTGADADKMRFDLTTEEIEALTFRVASIYFFLNGEDDLLFSGTVQVK